MQTTNNFKFKLTLDTRYISNDESKRGMFPVRLYVKSTYTNKNSYIKTGIYLTKKVFTALFPEFAKKDWKDHKTFFDTQKMIIKENEKVKNQLDALLRLYKDGATSSVLTIPQLLKNLGKSKGSTNLRDQYMNYREGLNNENTKEGYTYSYKSFVAYHNNLTTKELTDVWNENRPFRKLDILDITPEFLQDYEEFKLEENVSMSTISKYCRELRAVLNLAIDDDTIPYNKSMYPFGLLNRGKYQIKEDENTRNRYLDSKDLNKLKDYKPQSAAEQLAIDCWLFSYYSGGVNMIDIDSLKRDNLFLDKGYWTFYRNKNKSKKLQKEVKVTITEKAKEIIERNSWGKENRVFNFLDTRTHKTLLSNNNKRLKEIAEKIDIDRELHFQMARHTAFSNLYRKDVSFEKLIEISGHSKIKTLRNYIKSLGLEDKREIYELL